MTVSKDQLTARTRGKGGTIVRWRGQTLVVKDMMQRSTYNKPDRVGVGPVDKGVAWSADLADLELA